MRTPSEQDQELVVADVALKGEIVVLRRPGAALEIDAGQVFEQIGEVLVAPVTHLLAGETMMWDGSARGLRRGARP